MPLIIRLALPSDADDILDFLRAVYYRDEPLRNSIEPRNHPEEDEEFLMANIQYGTCLIAEENSRVHDDFYGQEMIGVLIAGPKYPGETEHLLELSRIVQSEKWSKILKLFAYLELRTDIYQRYHVEKAVHCHAVVVSERFRGKSITNKMLQKFMEIAFKLDFQVMTMDCTSMYAIRICENFNMECIFTLAYADYHDENGKQVFFPQGQHKHIKTYLQKL